MHVSEVEAGKILGKFSDAELSRLVDAGRNARVAECREILGLVDLIEGQTIGVNGELRLLSAQGGKATLVVSPRHKAGSAGG
jgi:hypothetical protein